MRQRLGWCVRAVALVMFLVPVAGADVRPISDAERAAVQIAAEYLAGGADAVLARLSSKSPLRAIPPVLQTTEIETLLGSTQNATWELVTVVEALKDKTAVFDVSYASGIDDTIFFDLVQEGGVYRVLNIRMTALPVPGGPVFNSVIAAGAEKRIGGGNIDALAGLTGIAAAILALVAVFVMPSQRLIGRVLFLAAFVCGGGAVSVAVLRGARLHIQTASIAGEQAVVQVEERRVSRLIALRNAITAGSDDVEATLEGLPKDGFIADVAKTWKAQWDFRQGKLDEVQSALATFPVASRIPLVEILRGRLALARNDSIGATVAYERAVNLGPGRDALWLEATTALMLAGFDKQAKRDLSRVAKLGSRDAGIYYTGAALATEPDACELLLKRAWSLIPAERSRLVASGVLWSLVRRRGPSFINLSDPYEATLASPSMSTRAIALPSVAKASVSGELLHIAVNDASLIVPNGACLAPVGTEAVDAGRWTRLFEEEALQSVPALLAAPPPLASFMQPVLRDRITNAVTTLARRNRWSDVVRLTESVATKSEFVPPDLFFLRANALQRLRRDDDAKHLLMELSESPVLERKRDAQVLEQLGDMLASYDLHDQGMRMFERAKSIREDGYSELRLTQIGMDKRLATQYSTHRSPNFEIRYPTDVSPAAAEGIARVLEGELVRLQRWIPVPAFRPVIVNIVWWKDFTAVYTGSEDVLGFYNGKITLPLAGVWSMDPMIVSLITHELSHAMLAQATNDQAPRWFHEGLAQRMQMVPYSANAFNMYEDDRLLAVSVLDPVLATSRDPDMVGAAYIVSQTFVRYVEHSLGEAGMRQLIARFAQGATTEEAIAAVSGKSLADFDSAFRKWGRAENRVFENPVPVRYDEEAEADPLQRRQRGSLGKGNLYPLKRGGS